MSVNFELFTHTITLAAGGKYKLEKFGAAVAILSGSGPVTIRFYNPNAVGQQIGIASGVDKSFKSVGSIERPFGAIEIESATAQTIQFVVSTDPVSINQIVGEVSVEQGSGISNDVVSVLVTATQLAAANSDRKSLRFFNDGSATVYMGPYDVTAADGLPLGAGDTWIESEGAAAAWYAIAASTTQSVRVQEIS